MQSWTQKAEISFIHELGTYFPPLKRLEAANATAAETGEKATIATKAALAAIEAVKTASTLEKGEAVALANDLAEAAVKAVARAKTTEMTAYKAASIPDAGYAERCVEGYLKALECRTQGFRKGMVLTESRRQALRVAALDRLLKIRQEAAAHGAA